MSNLVAPIVARFGGTRPMARKLGIPCNTVQYWKRSGWIPANRISAILDAAKDHDVEVTRDQLVAAVMAKPQAAA